MVDAGTAPVVFVGDIVRSLHQEQGKPHPLLAVLQAQNLPLLQSRMPDQRRLAFSDLRQLAPAGLVLEIFARHIPGGRPCIALVDIDRDRAGRIGSIQAAE